MSNTTQVVQLQSRDIPIGSLFLDRGRYEDSAPFQRAVIWPEKMKRNLVDSILRGFYIPALLVNPRFDDVRGQMYEVVDGQQRLAAILEFMDDKFRTGRADNTGEPYYTPLEQNKLFSQLSLELQERFRSYPLHFLILDNVSGNLLGVMFRRLQNQIPLTTAEKLYSFMSEATRQAGIIANHHIFQEIYKGRTSRREAFQCGLYFLLLEISGGFAHLDINRMQAFAVGKRDEEISAAAISQVERRLDLICHLFQGLRARALLELVLVYQTVLLLELAGYDILQSEPGCLTSWLERLQQEQIMQQREKGYMTLFYMLAKVNTQKHFWVNQLAGISSIEGLHTPNKVYSYDQIDRITSWIKQSGICLECHRPVRLLDIIHHCLRQKDRYDRSLQTCAVFPVRYGGQKQEEEETRRGRGRSRKALALPPP